MKIFLLVLNIVMALIGAPMIMRMLKNNKIVAPNYKNENIPICLGMLFVIIQTVSLSLYTLYYQDIKIILLLIGILTMGFVGLLDDLTGDTEVKGLKGHISSFFKGSLTTGFIKASVGFFISLILAIYISENIINTIINTFIIALSINTLNLFDLRPGRALKVFNFIGLLLLLVSNFYNWYILTSMLVITMVYFKYDIKAEAMMGDVGSNVLGLSLGYYCALSQGLYMRIGYLMVLIVLHLVAEKVSISKIIENNKYLNYIDQLGR